jgi:hypothetical protein
VRGTLSCVALFLASLAAGFVSRKAAMREGFATAVVGKDVIAQRSIFPVAVPHDVFIG